MDLNGIGWKCVDWINLACDGKKLRSVVNALVFVDFQCL